MPVHICLLRGVNMAGHNKIKMTDLKEMFRKLGFPDAETFIQTGNIIFTADSIYSSVELTLKIESEIRKGFGLEIAALLRSKGDLERILSSNPFVTLNEFNPARSAVIFLYKELFKKDLEKLAEVDYPPDKFKVIGKEIFIYCPNGFGRTKLYTNFFENKTGVKGTARNWNTINTLFGLASQKTLS
jgi:uncharacterized protein (DUF1697 family)